MAPRITAPDDDSMSDRTTELLALAATRSGTVPPTIGVLAHSFKLLQPFLTWAGALSLQGQLEVREHEILALRVSHLCNSSFEWDEHTGFAREAGLSEEEIEAIRQGSLDSPADQALLAATDQLHGYARVDDETYALLAEHFSEAQLVEIPMVVGQYAMLSMLTGFAGIESNRP